MVEPSADVSFRDVTIDETAQTVTLQRPLLLDLGAVAKGLAVDLAARELAPLRDFAIDAGGDLYLGGTNRDGQPWSIGIRHPRQPGACIAAVRVSESGGLHVGRLRATAARQAASGEPDGARPRRSITSSIRERASRRRMSRA